MVSNSTKEIAIVFDLDKTIGYFTKVAIFLEGIEEYIKRKLKLQEFFKLLDLFPTVFRPDIFKIFKFLKDLKQSTRQRFVALEFDYPSADVE